MSARGYRLTSAAIAVLCGVIVWQVVGLIRTSGGSPLMWVAGVVIGFVGIAAFGLTFARESTLSRLDDHRSTLLHQLRSTARVDVPRLGRGLMALGVAGYLLITGWHLSHADQPIDDDQAAFLATASEVYDAGGPLSLIRDLYAGRFSEANRHPLYIGLLSLHPTWSFGRGLSLTIGLTTLLLLTWLVRRRQGDLVAGLFCLLLGTNGAFCLFSTRVVCEVLMVLWAGLAYVMVTRSPLTMWRAAGLGTSLGLAYLTKGTGLLLIVAAVLWLLIVSIHRSRFGSGSNIKSAEKPQASSASGRLMTWTVVLGATAVVTSPLVTRNVRLYGSPFHNVNSQLMFVDEYEDPVALAEQRSTGEAARAYLQTHTVGDIIHREVSGLVWESFILLRILGPAPFDDARVLFGLPLFLCALIAVVADPRREHVLLAIWILICTGLFAWYIPVAAGDRFPLPLLAPLLMLSAEGLARLVTLTRRSGETTA